MSYLYIDYCACYLPQEEQENKKKKNDEEEKKDQQQMLYSLTLDLEPNQNQLQSHKMQAGPSNPSVISIILLFM